MGLPDSEERSREVASGEKYRTECDNTYICPIICSIKTKQQANSKLSTQSAKGLNYWLKVLPTSHSSLNASASKNTWWPIISYVLTLFLAALCTVDSVIPSAHLNCCSWSQHNKPQSPPSTFTANQKLDLISTSQLIHWYRRSTPRLTDNYSNYLHYIHILVNTDSYFQLVNTKLSISKHLDSSLL